MRISVNSLPTRRVVEPAMNHTALRAGAYPHVSFGKNMAYTFELNNESLKREYAVYVVVVKSQDGITLYVGKTGDNREGCNPIISRCGNHFSYNKIHSQIRNKIENHESCQYTYVFDHFGCYSEVEELRIESVNQINEMERWLNQEIQHMVSSRMHCVVANPYKGSGFIKNPEKKKRFSYRTASNEKAIKAIVEAVTKIIEN